MGKCDNVFQVFQAEIIIDIQAELGRFQGNMGIDFILVDRFDHIHDILFRFERCFLFENELTQVVDRRADSLRIQTADTFNGLFDIGPGHYGLGT